MDSIAETGRQWQRHEWPSLTAMLAQTSVQRTHQLMINELEKALQPFGLTLPRFEVLVVLLFSQNGYLPLGRIGKRLQVHPTSVTSLIDGLQKQGNVVRVADPADRRKSLAMLTAQGRDLVMSAKDAIFDFYATFGLDEDERRELIRLLTKIRKAMGDDVNEATLKALLEE